MWNLRAYGDNTALTDDHGRSLTYYELADEAERIGAAVPARSLVFSFCSNRIDSVTGYVGFLENRIVPVLIKYDLEAGLRAQLMETYRPQYLYMPAELGGEEAFAGLQRVYETKEYVLLKSEYEGAPELFPELALLLTTSGSTGSPKLVRQSYRNIEANTASIVEYLRLTPGERAITTLPMNYTYGLSIINSHLMAGAAICLTELSVLRGEFWDYFDKVQATSFGGVPYTYEILYRLGFTKRTLQSLRYMTQAGGKITPDLHRIFAEYAERTGTQFIVMYGQTEATARMAYLPGDKALEKAGSTGIAIPGGKLWLRDVDGSVIEEPDRVGELIYEGPNVTLGYAEKREDLARGDERGGVLETGDMARRDADGYYYITGRLKRFLKIYGNRVNLDETERLLRRQFPDPDLACAGRDDLLIVYMVSEDRTLHRQVRQFLAETTGLSPLAFKVKAVQEIPRSDSGKIRYQELS